MLLIYIAIWVPYRIGFNDDASPWDPAFIFDVCVDVYFIFDLVQSAAHHVCV